MYTRPQKRLIVEIDEATHHEIKGAALASGQTVRRLVLDAVHRDLEQRRKALVRPDPEREPCR